MAVPQLFRCPGYEAVTRERLGPELVKNAVILGSGPAAPGLGPLLAGDTIVIALNNAHRACGRVDFSLYADDLPPDQRHPHTAVIGRSSPHYSPALQHFGGILHCGSTMAFNAGYWALLNLPFAQISYFACDLHYPQGRSHFYGNGRPDPLRRDVSLQSLPALALRLFFFGLQHQVLFLNASAEPQTRLCLPRVTSGLSLRRCLLDGRRSLIEDWLTRLRPQAEAAIALESAAPFDARRHDYWVYENDTRVWSHVRAVADRWLALTAPMEGIAREIADRFAALSGPPADVASCR
jgi:hypothetical protein